MISIFAYVNLNRGNIVNRGNIAQSAGAVEYTDRVSAEE